jgi:arylsulfatase A-like enzyme
VNIVLLTIDCWRGDHLGALGAVPSPTPHLDRLAAEGTVFRQAITAGGWTRPAMMALFSSVYASRHHGGSLRRLAPELPVLSELLQAHGYHTAGFTANLVCGRRGDFDRGFDAFADLRTKDRLSLVWNRFRRIRGFTRATNPILSRPATHQLLRLFGLRLKLPEVSPSARQLTDEVLAWLGKSPGRPWFLWAHYIDVHWPYRLSRRPHRPHEIAQAWQDRQVYRRVVQSQGRFDPGAETRARWKQLYREELMTVDEQIGRLIAHLRTSGQWPHTVIVATSDHGEEFYEHGTWAHSWNQLFDEGVRVPLVVRVPGLTGGRSVRQQVSLLDVAPTLLTLVGAEPPETMLGVSLQTLLDGTAPTADQPPVRSEAIVEMLGHRKSARYRLGVRTEPHRYIHDIDQPHGNQLYDRHADPLEQLNSYSKADPVARRFDELRFEHMAPIIPDLLELDKEADALDGFEPEVADRLRAMGYIS